MSKVETEDLPANVTVVEPVANSYCITIKLRKISIRITLINFGTKISAKEIHVVCYCSGIVTYKVILSCSFFFISDL
jgi:hypothetical protein